MHPASTLIVPHQAEIQQRAKDFHDEELEKAREELKQLHQEHDEMKSTLEEAGKGEQGMDRDRGMGQGV